jgi:hypothetical protein
MKCLLVVVGMFLAIPLARGAEPASASEVPLDPRVETALQDGKLKYAVDEGDFRLVYKLGAGRSQVVWIASKTARVTQLEIRDVWSLAFRGAGQVPPEMAKRLLTENARMVLGAWQVNQAPDKFLVVYLAQVPADTDAAALQEVVEAVAVSADRMEKELTGGDEF